MLPDYIYILNDKKVLTKKDLKIIDFSCFDIDERIIVKGKPRQILWHIINHEKTFPKCKNINCGNELNWVSDQNKYRKYCSYKCRATCEEYKNNQIIHNIKKYGVENILLSPDVQEKRKNNNLKKYGVEYTFQNDGIRNKAEQNRKSSKSKEKLINTLQHKYGIGCIGHIHTPKDSLQILKDKNTFQNLIDNYSPQGIANKLNIDRNTVIRYCQIYNITPNKYISSLEADMRLFLTELGIDFIQNDKTIITPYELDFYLPEYNLAIEMNGDHWHSDKFKDKLYHYNKWKWCKETNIKLLTIFETEWYAKSDIIKNIIKNNIGINNNKIHGRKFIIKRIDTANYRNMVEKYHIQGFVSGIAYYGGFIGDEIKAAMCFSYTRGNKENRRFELRRWVSDFGIYPGLFSKIFKFAKIDLNFTNVVSFSDNRWFDGKSYEKIGFKKGAEIGPAYHYLYRNEVVHCSRFTKNNILKKFPEIDFNDCSTETEMMTKIGIPKIWDCGKQEWIYETII